MKTMSIVAIIGTIIRAVHSFTFFGPSNWMTVINTDENTPGASFGEQVPG
jgi:hypothetical protein